MIINKDEEGANLIRALQNFQNDKRLAMIDHKIENGKYPNLANNPHYQVLKKSSQKTEQSQARDILGETPSKNKFLNKPIRRIKRPDSQTNCVFKIDDRLAEIMSDSCYSTLRE